MKSSDWLSVCVEAPSGPQHLRHTSWHCLPQMTSFASAKWRLAVSIEMCFRVKTLSGCVVQSSILVIVPKWIGTRIFQTRETHDGDCQTGPKVNSGCMHARLQFRHRSTIPCCPFLPKGLIRGRNLLYFCTCTLDNNVLSQYYRKKDTKPEPTQQCTNLSILLSTSSIVSQFSLNNNSRTRRKVASWTDTSSSRDLLRVTIPHLKRGRALQEHHHPVSLDEWTAWSAITILKLLAFFFSADWVAQLPRNFEGEQGPQRTENKAASQKNKKEVHLLFRHKTLRWSRRSTTAAIIITMPIIAVHHHVPTTTTSTIITKSRAIISTLWKPRNQDIADAEDYQEHQQQLNTFCWKTRLLNPWLLTETKISLLLEARRLDIGSKMTASTLATALLSQMRLWPPPTTLFHCRHATRFIQHRSHLLMKGGEMPVCFVVAVQQILPISCTRTAGIQTTIPPSLFLESMELHDVWGTNGSSQPLANW